MKLSVAQMRKASALIALLAILPASAWSFGGSGGGRPSGPPPEAIEACEGKSEGDTVSFETPRGDTVAGICQEIDGQLVAFPENGKRGPRGQSR